MRKYNKFLKVIMVLVLCIGIFPLHIQDTYGYEIDSQWNDDETLKVLSIGNSFSLPELVIIIPAFLVIFILLLTV